MMSLESFDVLLDSTQPGKMTRTLVFSDNEIVHSLKLGQQLEIDGYIGTILKITGYPGHEYISVLFWIKEGIC